MTMKKSIYALKLHETTQIKTKSYKEDGSLDVKTFYVTRVIDGWVYKKTPTDKKFAFVPALQHDHSIAHSTREKSA